MPASPPLRRPPSRRRAPAVAVLVAALLTTGLSLALPGGVAPAAAAVSTVTGPDVSNWNHSAPINMNQVKAAGNAFVFVKATEGAGTHKYTNPYYKGDVANAHAAGLFHGAYNYAKPALPVSTAADQANAFADTVGWVHDPMDLPPVVDLEESGGLNPTELALWLQVWLNTAQARFGRKPMIYSAPYFWSTAMAGSTQFTSYPLWQAEWTSAASPSRMGGWSKPTFWQYTATASVPGITGAADMNRFQGTAAELVALAAERPSNSPYPDGTFLVSRANGAVYRTAGGAPLYVSDWGVVPPGAAMRWVDQAIIDSLPAVPADGTVLVGAQRGEWYVVAGGAPIYTSTFAVVPPGTPATYVDQVAIDNAGGPGPWGRLRSRPADGTVLIGAQRGEWYVVAGGAPIYTSTLAAVPPGTSATYVDQLAIDFAGWSGVFHLSARPAEGTAIVGAQRGEVYVVAGGAPIYTSTFAVVPAGAPVTLVDQLAIDLAGTGGLWNRMAAVPADGTVLVGQQRGEVYIVAGGAPLYTSSVQPIAAGRRWIAVDVKAIDAAGGAGVWSHLRAKPADGTVLVGAQRGEWYIVAGGAPIYTSTFAPIPAGASVTLVDQAGLDAAGTARWKHLAAKPADGTVLVGAQRGEWYVVAGGAPLYTSTFAAVTPGARPVWVDNHSLDVAGAGGAWNHLALVPAASTMLRTHTQQLYQVNAQGQARPFVGSPLATPTLADQATVDNAGGPRPWHHLVR